MIYALGFIFLFTIGGLINLLALPLKTTICEKLLTIIILWYFLIFKIKQVLRALFRIKMFFYKTIIKRVFSKLDGNLTIDTSTHQKHECKKS